MKIFDAVTITANFADTRVEIPAVNRTSGVLHVSYAQGNEVSLEILVEYSPKGDTVGAEDWVQLADYERGVGGILNVEPITLNLMGNQKVRIPIPGLAGEDKYRVSIRGVGGGSQDGTVTVYVVV